jgi:hypothetical protein
MSRVSLVFASLLSFAVALPVTAQSDLERICATPEIELLGARDACVVTSQAVASAQPLVGLLIAGGNPTIGTSGVDGLRLGFLPRVSAGARLNLVSIRLPDILVDQAPGQIADLTRRFGTPVPAVMGDASLMITRGVSVAPGLRGIGAISLLGSASYLPFRISGVDGFDRDRPSVGFGARVNLMEESFVAPGVSASLMYRRLPTVHFGQICPQGFVSVVETEGTPRRQMGACPGAGDIGEFSFGITDWSGRLVVSKRLLGVGAVAGIGRDRYESNLDFGFRSAREIPGTGTAAAIRFLDNEFGTTRYSVFANLSYSLLVGMIAVEAGWQQGAPPITGFRNLGSEFDPRGGTWFGGLGARLAL